MQTAKDTKDTINPTDAMIIARRRIESLSVAMVAKMDIKFPRMSRTEIPASCYNSYPFRPRLYSTQ